MPFYGPRKLPVAYEYYIQCGDQICGALYDVFPDITSMDGAMSLFRSGAKCLAAYPCDAGSNPPGLSLRTFFVPNAVPASIRLAASVPDGRVKFYHGIYVIGEKDRRVVSLDPRDDGITRQQLKQRLLGLIDFSTHSFTIPLIYERTRNREFFAPAAA